MLNVTTSSWMIPNESLWNLNLSVSTQMTSCDDDVIQFNRSSLWRAVVYGVVCVVGLLGNALAVVAVLRQGRKKRYPSDLYLINLCVADICFLATLPFIAVTILFRSWIFGSTLCVLNIVFANVNRYAGTFTLVALSVDRYMAVCYPLSAVRFRSTTSVTVVICITWLLAALPLLPALIYLAHETTPVSTSRIVSPSPSASTSPASVATDSSNCRKKCFIKWPDEMRETAVSFYAIYQATVGFFIPICVICLCYALLTRRLRESENNLHASSSTSTFQNSSSTGAFPVVNSQGRMSEPYLQHLMHHHQNPHHRQVTRLVLVVISVFIVCWLPYCAVQLYLLTIKRYSIIETNFFAVSVILCYINSMINPFLYTFTNKIIRAACVQMLVCSCPIRHTHSSTGDVITLQPLDNQLQMPNNRRARFEI